MELVKRKLLVSGIVTASKESRPVVPYLMEFWNYDISPYRKEELHSEKNCLTHILKQLLEASKSIGHHALKVNFLVTLLLMILQQFANLLAMYTGMRASEVQALRVCDIHENYIWISHGWDDHIGLKTPKNGEERPVPISRSPGALRCPSRTTCNVASPPECPLFAAIEK